MTKQKGIKIKECRNCKYLGKSIGSEGLPMCHRFPKWEHVYIFHHCGEFKKRKDNK